MPFHRNSGEFLDFFKKAYQKGELSFPPPIAHLGISKGFEELVDQLNKKRWVVFFKKPFAGTEKVLEYLGRYTHKVAISNYRIVSVKRAWLHLPMRPERWRH